LILRRRSVARRIRSHCHFVNRAPQRFSNVLVQGPELFRGAACAIDLPA
jgi:hypothetical protein